ncbi:MAG: hypothetical protein AB8B82_08320 [Roseovarius sp.]
MTPNKRILLAIAAFVTLTVGTFVWFIASWDPAKKQSLTGLPVDIQQTERLS